MNYLFMGTAFALTRARLIINETETPSFVACFSKACFCEGVNKNDTKTEFFSFAILLLFLIPAKLC